MQVLIQSNISDTVKKLAEAIRGGDDAANIAYGSGTNPHPTCTGYWTKQRFSIGDISVAPGESLFLLEKSEDTNTALTLTSTAASTINAFIRMPHLRYVMSGNVTGSGGTNSVRGPLHTILPIGSIIIGRSGRPAYPGAIRLSFGHHLSPIGHHRKGAGFLYLKRRAEFYPHLEKHTSRR